MSHVQPAGPYAPQPGTLFGLRVIIVPTWVHGMGWRWCGRPARIPSRADGRRGTRRAWARGRPNGWRWRYGPLEPREVLMTADALYCTRAQHAALLRRINDLS